MRHESYLISDEDNLALMMISETEVLQEKNYTANTQNESKITTEEYFHVSCVLTVELINDGTQPLICQFQKT